MTQTPPSGNASGQGGGYWGNQHPAGPPYTNGPAQKQTGPSGYPLGPPPANQPYPDPRQGQWGTQPQWHPQMPTHPAPPAPPTAGGGNANASLSRPTPPPNSIDNYRPPRSRWPFWMAGGAVALVIVALAVVGLYPNGLFPTPESPTPTTRTATTPDPGASVFESTTENASGYWRVVETVWDDGYVDVQIQIDCEQGDMTYSFFAFANTAAEGVDPSFSTRTPALTRGSVGEGSSIKGWVRFALPREDSTIVLATRSGRQISAVMIKG